MIWKTAVLLIAAGGCFGQIPPVPSDPLELVTGGVQTTDGAAQREPLVQLLARARSSYALRSVRRGYDLKVAFEVDSRGKTNYDGAWEMEDIFDPQQGLRWKANAAAGYAITEISSRTASYGEGTANVIPLRLQEARGALLDPIPAAASVERLTIRTSTASFHGATVTCVLLSAAGSSGGNGTGRRWEETEECIDPQSGLLQVHSQVPGRYAAYDYTDAPELLGKVMPSKVTITEGGRVVSTISVNSLTPLATADRSLYLPTAEMKVGGRAIEMAGAQKISRLIEVGRGAVPRAVCVLGVVTPTGQLVEAHSLQPTDPNSDAAVADAKTINFAPASASGMATPGARPQQHFVFVIEKFVSEK